VAYLKEFECKLKISVETAGKLLQRITATLTSAAGGMQRTMNWERYMMRWQLSNLRYSTNIFLEEQKKIEISVGTAGLRTMTRTQDFPNNH
jgi:hypothetical protein